MCKTSLSKTQYILFFESGDYVRQSEDCPKHYACSLLYGFVVLIISDESYIIVLVFLTVAIVLVIVHIISIRIRLSPGRSWSMIS